MSFQFSINNLIYIGEPYNEERISFTTIAPKFSVSKDFNVIFADFAFALIKLLSTNSV